MKKLILIAGLLIVPFLIVQSQTMTDIANLLDAYGDKVQQTPTNDLKPITSPTTSSDLSEQIKELEHMMEEVRNDRQQANSAYDNYDAKANELYNMLSKVLKSMKEMQSSTTRNML